MSESERMGSRKAEASSETEIVPLEGSRGMVSSETEIASLEGSRDRSLERDGVRFARGVKR